eukprot:3405701-Amphidinium_carterae.1
MADNLSRVKFQELQLHSISNSRFTLISSTNKIPNMPKRKTHNNKAQLAICYNSFPQWRCDAFMAKQFGSRYLARIHP